MALADRRLFFPGRARGRQLLPRDADGSLRQGARPTPGPARLSQRVPPRRPLWARADRRPRAAGALLAHVDRVGNLPAHDQDLLADVARRVGAAVLRRVRLSLVRRGAGRAWLARLAAPSPSQPAGVLGSVGDGDRRAARLLRGGLYGRAPCRHEPADLGGHGAARAHLLDLGGLDVGGAADPARFLVGRGGRQHRRARGFRCIHPRPRGGRHGRADRLARKDRDGLAEWVGPPPRRDGARRDRASFIYALAGPRPPMGAPAGPDPARRPDPPSRHHLFFGPDHIIGRWRSIVVLLVAAVAVGCTSPEATRTRGGGAGADVGNHPRGAVQLHAGKQVYYRTGTDRVGIGKRAFIGGVAEAGGETDDFPSLRPI